LAEFPPAVLEALRQPLEEGVVRVSRAGASVCFPARFILVGAMNPCPCGEGGLPGTCRCRPSAKDRYARRLSGPLLDRFDIAVRVARPAVEDLLDVTERQEENTATVSARVARLAQFAPMSKEATELIEEHLRIGLLSARGYDRVRRIARTVADLSGGADRIELLHVREALLLRSQRNLIVGEDR